MAFTPLRHLPFAFDGLAVTVALIDEQRCVGCTLCVQACPVNAIVGAAKLMHTVIAGECIGCKLCLPPCPADCIAMVATGKGLGREQKRQAVLRARSRFELRAARLDRERRTSAGAAGAENAADLKRRTIQRAIERARRRLAQRKPLGK